MHGKTFKLILLSSPEWFSSISIPADSVAGEDQIPGRMGACSLWSPCMALADFSIWASQLFLQIKHLLWTCHPPLSCLHPTPPKQESWDFSTFFSPLLDPCVSLPVSMGVQQFLPLCCCCFSLHQGPICRQSHNFTSAVQKCDFVLPNNQYNTWHPLKKMKDISYTTMSNIPKDIWDTP